MRALDREHSGDFADLVDDLVAHTGRRGVQQCIQRLAREAPAYLDNDGRYRQRGKRVGLIEPRHIVCAPSPHECQPGDHNRARPDIGGKVERVGLERLAGVLVRHAAQRARAAVVENDRHGHHEHGPYVRLNLHGMEEEALDRLIDDPYAGGKEQAGFDEGGDVLDLAVAVLVLRVGGQVTDAHREEGDDRGHQIERRVQRLGKDAEAAAHQAYDELEEGDRNGHQHAVACHAMLLRTHAVVHRFGSCHAVRICGHGRVPCRYFLPQYTPATPKV